MNENPWLKIVLAMEPEAVNLIKALLALRKKYPALNPADILAAVGTITAEADTAFDDVLAKIAADQAAHPTA